MTGTAATAGGREQREGNGIGAKLIVTTTMATMGGGHEKRELDIVRAGDDVTAMLTTAGGCEQSDRDGGGPGVM